MPEVCMGEDDYDLAGFAVGITEKSQIIDGSKVAEDLTFLDLLQVVSTQMVTHSCVVSLLITQVKKFFQNLKAKNFKDVLLRCNSYLRQRKQPCHS